MDIYQEAVGYLESQQVPGRALRPSQMETCVIHPACVPGEYGVKMEALEEEEVSCLLSPLHTDGLDLPDTPVSPVDETDLCFCNLSLFFFLFLFSTASLKKEGNVHVQGFI